MPSPSRVVVDLRRLPDLECTYRAFAGEIERFAARHLREPADAAAVVEEVFVRAWRQGWQEAAIGPELRIRMLRAAGDVVGERGIGPATGGDTLVRWCVEQELAALEPAERRAVVESALRRRPHEEVAAEEGVPVTVLRHRLSRGLRALASATAGVAAPPPPVTAHERAQHPRADQHTHRVDQEVTCSTAPRSDPFSPSCSPSRD